MKTMTKPTRFVPQDDHVTIFQDEFDLTVPMINQAPMPSAGKPRRPLAAAESNLIFNPPDATVNDKHSPQKTSTLQPSKLFHPNRFQQMVPMLAPNAKQKTTDSMPKKPQMSRFKTVAQKPLADSGRENVLLPAASLSIENYVPKGAKRPLEPAPIVKDSRPSKKIKLGDDAPLDPDSFPSIHDDGTKPGHSYAQLIGMAILRSPNRRLTLSQIYKWISDHFSYYAPNDAGWQNSIRHNLSLNKAFIKQERPKDDPGKGNYWAIEAGQEQSFLGQKPQRRSTVGSESVPVMTTRAIEPRPTTSSSHHGQAHGQMNPAALHSDSALPPSSSLSMAISQQPFLPDLSKLQESVGNRAAANTELSSDATIPAGSDMPGLDESALDLSMAVNASMAMSEQPELVLDANLFSPLPAGMHSSPPAMPRVALDASNLRQHGTPPQQHHRSHQHQPQPITSSAARGHKRKLTGTGSFTFDDSGYISSLSSSVVRNGAASNRPFLLTSEGDHHRDLTSATGAGGGRDRDRPRLKRGRAEEEIARLRNSSPISPSKGHGRSWNAGGNFAPLSSSPLRQSRGNGQMLPPLTPVVKLKPPLKAPPSVSPNTNLRLHRDRVTAMLDSPVERAKRSGLGGAGPSALLGLNAGLSGQTPWSPAFNLLIDESALGSVGGHNQHFGHHHASADAASSAMLDALELEFEVFDDSGFGSIFPHMSADVMASPLARRSVGGSSAKRARLDRSMSTSALGDITNSAHHNHHHHHHGSSNRMATANFLKLPPPSGTSLFDLETPSKILEDLPTLPDNFFPMSSPIKAHRGSAHGHSLSQPEAAMHSSDWLVAEDLYGDADFMGGASKDEEDLPLMTGDENTGTPAAAAAARPLAKPASSDCAGFDMLQGFQKIGTAGVANTENQPPPRPAKHALGRSYSTAF